MSRNCDYGKLFSTGHMSYITAMEANADPRVERATPTLIASLAAPASAKAVLLALMQIKGGALRVQLPDGVPVLFGEPAEAAIDLTIHDYAFAKRVLSHGDIGFAEGLMAGEWNSEDIPALLTLLAGNIERFMRLLEGGPIGKALTLSLIHI